MIRSATLAGLLAAVSGCHQPVAVDTETDTSTGSTAIVQAETPADAPSASDGQDVTLTACSFTDLQQQIASYCGRIVVVDYWSTQCPPCMEEFPELVRLSRKYPDDQVVCISASLDFEDFGDNTVETASKRALEFLTSQQATLHNVILNEDSIDVQEKELGTGIPVVIVYDIDGSEVKRFDETLGRPFTYQQDILPFVDGLVASRFRDSDN